MISSEVVDLEDPAIGGSNVRNAENRIWPFLVQKGMGTLDSFVEVLYFGTADEDGLATSSVVFLVQSITEALTHSLLIPIQNLIAQKHITDKQAAGSIYQQGLVLGSLMSVPAMLLLWSAKPILKQLNYSNDIVNLTSQYTLASLFGVLPTKWLVIDLLFLEAIDQEKIIAGWSVINFSIGILLKWAFVNQLGQGVVGLGLANSLQAWIGLILLKLYIYRNLNYREYALFSPRIRETIFYLRKIVRLALPIMLPATLQLVESIIRNHLIAGLPRSNDSLALDQSISQLLELANFPVSALQAASQITLSQQLENREFSNIRQQGNRTLSQTIILSILCGIPIPLLYRQMFGPFSHTPNSYPLYLRQQVLWLSIFANLFTNAADTLSSNFYALNDTLWPSVWLTGFSFMYLIAAGFIGLRFANDLRGLYASNIALISLLSAMLTYRWSKKDFAACANPQQFVQSDSFIDRYYLRLFGQGKRDKGNVNDSVALESDNNGHKQLSSLELKKLH